MRAIFLVTVLISASLAAQNLSLKGRVTDESGAVVPSANVELGGPGGVVKTAKTNQDGEYLFSQLSPGSYTVSASAPQLTLRQPLSVSLRAGTETLNIVLQVFLENQKVSVEENAKPSVSTDASSNASARVIQGSDLDALSDNPDDLAADLAALAGPAAGPSGGAIFIDGFSGGQMPPKSSIREVRINQNPFSPEYDKLGVGRIEIFTKPGTERFHADLGYNFATDKWNSRNPYAGQKAAFSLHEFRESVSGPLGKRSSFNLALIREWVDNGNAVNAVVLDPATLKISPFTDTPVAELQRTLVTPRFDHQLSTNHTLSVRYSYNRDIVRNAGTGAFNLVSRGYHNDALSQTVQLTETAILNEHTINETRFQYFRPSTVAQANTPGSPIQVLGAFNGGGNPIGRSSDVQNTFEFQNNTSVVRGLHTFRFGVRARAEKDNNLSQQNYAGTFTFAGGVGPQLDFNERPVLDAGGSPVLVNISSIENYRRTLVFQRAGLPSLLIRQLGGGASQFSINAGNPSVSGTQSDIGVFFGDDWRQRSNLTVSIGMRFEKQTNMQDWTNFAPRVGIAWGPGGGSQTRPKSVIRVGFGMFYDRFALANVLMAQRYNGTVQQQYIVANPDFYPSAPPITLLPDPDSSTLQRISPSLRAPYLMQSALSFERQLTTGTTVAVTYVNTHGLHIFRSRNTNAPLPGTFDPTVPGSGVYPLGRPGLIVLMESSGPYNQNQLLLNVNPN